MAHPALLPPLQGGLQLTELRSVLQTTVEQAVTGLRELSADLPSKDDRERYSLASRSHR